MKRHGPPRDPRGFMLIEMMVWLTIIAVVMLLLTEMMISGMRIAKQTTARDILIGRVDSALDALRRDAWRAESIQAIGSEVAFVEPDGVIFWRMEAGHVLTRLNPAEAPLKKTWNEMPTFAFSTAGPFLKVDVDSGPDAARHESTTLVSQRLLAGGVP
jgi:type II secretory pathway pseudopilin PulG